MMMLMMRVRRLLSTSSSDPMPSARTETRR